jgi:hypothetical protein
VGNSKFSAVDWSQLPVFNTPQGRYGPVLKTAFALLFLKRSHPMRELTLKLPYTAKELNERIARLRPSEGNLEGSTATPSRNRKSER